MAKAKKAESQNEFDPYREKLVVEHLTIWSDEFDGYDRTQKADLEAKLHASPEKAAKLEYMRQHTGFARVITATGEDVAGLA